MQPGTLTGSNSVAPTDTKTKQGSEKRMPEDPNHYAPGLNQGEDIDEIADDHTKTLAAWLEEKEKETD